MNFKLFSKLLLPIALIFTFSYSEAQSYLGTKAPKGAKVYLKGSAKSLHKNWKYWEGPRF